MVELAELGAGALALLEVGSPVFVRTGAKDRPICARLGVGAVKGVHGVRGRALCVPDKP